MARRSGYVLRRGVQRRETLWIGASVGFTTMGLAQAVLVASLNAAALALRPFTIVRTRGYFNVRSDQISALENFTAAFGAAVVSDQSVAIGVTAVPTPTTDSGSDLFFVYESVSGTVVNSASGMPLMTERIIDSKAMRKVNDDQDVIFVVENPLATGVVTVDFGRILVKLH